MKRYYNEETTLDVIWYDFHVRVWIVNPYQTVDYTDESVLQVCDNSTSLLNSLTDKELADKIVGDVVAHFPDLAAVQVIRPDNIGHMVYTTEYNGDKV